MFDLNELDPYIAAYLAIERYLGETGIVGDRRWALRDAASGGLRSGKKVSALMKCTATTDGPDSPAARIVLPDGTVTSCGATPRAAGAYQPLGWNDPVTHPKVWYFMQSSARTIP